MFAENFLFHVMQDNTEINSLSCFSNLIFTDLKFILLGPCARTMCATQDLSGGSIPTESQMSAFQLSPERPLGNLLVRRGYNHMMIARMPSLWRGWYKHAKTKTFLSFSQNFPFEACLKIETSGTFLS